MKILSIHPDSAPCLKRRMLENKFEKQELLFEHNPAHPSLGTEILEPRQMRIWSFRIDRKYRAIFIFRDRNTIEIIDVNNHYR